MTRRHGARAFTVRSARPEKNPTLSASCCCTAALRYSCLRAAGARFPLTVVNHGSAAPSVHTNAGADNGQLPASSSESRLCQGQMAATGQPDSDAVELAVIRAQRIDRHRAAQFRKRSGSFFRIHHGRGSNPNSVVHGLTAAASATYVCKALGCSALVDAGRARASAANAQRTWFQCSDGCANNGCAKRFRAVRFKARQLAMADALDNGSRWLADWPAGIGYGVGQRRGSAAARLAGAAARQQLAQ